MLFADETTLWYQDKQVVELCKILELDLKLIAVWIEKNALLLNYDKTQAIYFKFRFNFNDSELNLTFCGTKIEFVKEAKLLGVILDHKLNFNRHTDSISKDKSKTHLIARSIKLL